MKKLIMKYGRRVGLVVAGLALTGLSALGVRRYRKRK